MRRGFLPQRAPVDFAIRPRGSWPASEHAFTVKGTPGRRRRCRIPALPHGKRRRTRRTGGTWNWCLRRGVRCARPRAVRSTCHGMPPQGPALHRAESQRQWISDQFNQSSHSQPGTQHCGYYRVKHSPEQTTKHHHQGSHPSNNNHADACMPRPVRRPCPYTARS